MIFSQIRNLISMSLLEFSTRFMFIADDSDNIAAIPFMR
jgi:hypothetical protein